MHARTSTGSIAGAHSRSTPPRGFRRALSPISFRFVLPVLLALVTGCVRSVAVFTPEQIAEVNPAQVDRVLYLVGDAGLARTETHPLINRLREDVEEWSERLGRDSAVAVLLLGDNIYPLGLHPVDSPEFDSDTSVLMSQVRVVTGPAAVARKSQAFFLAGNHDVGLKQDYEGFVRVKAMEDFLTAAAMRTGASVRMAPSAATGGPFVLDWGRNVRLILLDTAWWILEAEIAQKNLVLQLVEEAMSTAGDRKVIFAAHHPFRTAGPHGGEVSFWRTLGMQYLLTRSGAILQDLTSAPYRRLEGGLRNIFARHGPPFMFAGGHEHSLQIIDAQEPTDPRHMIVSGSASKTTSVGSIEGLRFASATNGYMRVVFETDGDVAVYVVAAPGPTQTCPAEGPEHAGCMATGMAAIQTVHSTYLR